VPADEHGFSERANVPRGRSPSISTAPSTWGRQAVPGAPQVVAHVRDSGLDVLFLTNASSVDSGRLAKRLAGLAIIARPGEIYSSASVAAR
jgi:ribonucleotide monophosphatase NagD (HAD superfamily)